MAAFSYQHHYPHLLDASSVLLLMEEGNFFSQLYPQKFPSHDQEIIGTNKPLDGGVSESSCVYHHSDNEPSSNNSAETTDNRNTNVSSAEPVTQSITTHMDKKRKNITTNGSSLISSSQSKEPREVKSKKQKKINDAQEKNTPNKADEKKVADEEPQKDYIHVRARRGQATDSHSLAERVRREKISERMKILQRLVPGCDKVTGKALMLDEIINYVQSLQNQVELLSVKLASVNLMYYHFETDLDHKFMVKPEQQSLNGIAASAPLQCSPTTDLTAFAPSVHNNNYPILDSALLLLQQGQKPNDFISQDNGNSQLWDMEDQKQKILDPSVFNNNYLCSFH